MLHIHEIEDALRKDEYLNKTVGMMISPLGIDKFDDNLEGWFEDCQYLIREKWMDAGFPMILFKKDGKWASIAARHGGETIEELRNDPNIQFFETAEEIIAEVNKYWGPDVV